ncbi:alpha/beta fold hydrolase [Actinoplanes sp. CA-252034]|uniref:alpha/beta fold hydrolase n=1 Tax=Actinoplanes sp. CA-252034 TaxID=3239906 RepID=UPI003D97127F
MVARGAVSPLAGTSRSRQSRRDDITHRTGTIPADQLDFPPERRDARQRIGGRAIAYTIAGHGEPLLLLHGLGGTRRTWDRMIDTLAATHTVIAPDLPGHGDSDAPADYSLGAHAAALRDLLVALHHPSVSVVGHSLGGGIALQFAYQFPDRVSRLALISSGGLGSELTPLLRGATLPGAEAVVAALALVPQPVTRWALPRLVRVVPLLARPDADAVAEGLHLLAHRGRRRSFVRTARTVITWRGQAVNAVDHLQQLAGLPVLLAWGADDRTIPPSHHRAVADLLTDPHLVEIAGAGHYPHETAPERLLPPLQHFLTTSTPFRYTEDRWRRLLTPDPEAA